jgi:radical SAM protein with 4Fe4S-binding SPASM domain
MLSRGLAYLEEKTSRLPHRPILGQLALTYRCDYDCVHCYCKGSEKLGRELTTAEIKRILDEVSAAGCFWLTLTGGDPLVRRDFKEIYAYAKRKGFIITVLTNGYRLGRAITDYFAHYPPLSIDITLNSLNTHSYSKITKSSETALRRVRDNIEYAVFKGLTIIIKANCLKENKDQIPKIKRWAYALLTKCPPEKKANFRYDPIIYPRLNGNTEPCEHRLSLKEIEKIRKLDSDIKKDHKKYLKKQFPKAKTPHRFLYFCNNFKEQFFIDPFGRLKFCEHTDKFSVNLREVSFKQGFYKEIPKFTKERFKTNSVCRVCRLRLLCYSCPAAAFLENGDEEKPVEYFCSLAHYTARASRATD